MNQTLMLASTCTTTILAVTAVASLCSDLLYRKRVAIQQRLNSEFNLQDKQSLHKSPLFRDLKMLQSKTGINREYADWWIEFNAHVEQSGLPWTSWQVIWTSVAVGTIAATITLAFRWGIVAPALIGILGMAIPVLVVEIFRQRRLALLCQQLPDAFDQLKRSIRAGQTLMIAMQQVANDFPAPLADEFATCCQQHELGLSHAMALQNLGQRINIMELRLFVVSALVQREVGGNFSEILTNLSTVVRKRLRLASRVKAATAEGRMQAIVLAMLPVIAGVAMSVLNPEYARVLLEYPRVLIALMASELIGVIWIRRIVNFDY